MLVLMASGWMCADEEDLQRAARQPARALSGSGAFGSLQLCLAHRLRDDGLTSEPSGSS